MKCRLCQKESNYLEKHHIIPKSKGGTDDKYNLIKICITCHSKVHNVSFSRKGSGLVVDSLTKKKEELKNASLWLKQPENEKKVYDKLMEVYDNEGVSKYSYLIELIENNIITNYNLMVWLETGELTFKKKNKIKIY